MTKGEGMNFHNATGSYTGSTVKYGARRQVRARRRLNLFLSFDSLARVGKVVVWVLPVLLLVNLMCSSAISSMTHSTNQLQTLNKELESENVALLAQKALVGSETNVRKLASEKLGLENKTKGQVGLFNRRFGRFDYN